MKKFSDISEALKAKTIVLFFGRVNPPTVGHLLAFTATRQIAGTLGADYAIILSRTQDKTNNPLTLAQKLEYVNLFFPGFNVVGAGDKTNTPIEVLKQYNRKYKNLVYVCGSDRIEEFTRLFSKYNGSEYNYDSIRVVSAGERDPDADGAVGMSGSKMRKAAVDNDLATFKKGLLPHAREIDVKRMMKNVRTGMGLDVIKEAVDFTTTDVREKYVAGEIFLENTFVEAGSKTFKIINRNSNYITVSDENSVLSKKWLTAVRPIEVSEEVKAKFEGISAMKFNSSDKLKVAKIIGGMLGADVDKSSSPEQIVNAGLRIARNKPLNDEAVSILQKMMKTADDAGIAYDAKLIPSKVAKPEEATVESVVVEGLSASDPAGKWITDFVNSKDPRFEGKPKSKRIQMALAAHYAAKREANEETVRDSADFIIDPKTGRKMRAKRIVLDDKNESVLDEAKKKIGEYTNGSNVTKVYKLSGEHDEGDPYVVQLHKNGKHYEPADYFTNDAEDAHGTAKHMVKESIDESSVQYMAKYKREGKSFSLWRKGEHWYELTHSSQGGDGYKHVKDWHDASHEDIHAELTKNGYNRMTESTVSEMAISTQKVGDVGHIINWAGGKGKGKGKYFSKLHPTHKDFSVDKMAPLTEGANEVSVKKRDYSWGKMMTVTHGSSTSYPLHPEHQEKIKALNDGGIATFIDETNRVVKAERKGDSIHLSHPSVSSTKTIVDRKHFVNESIYEEANYMSDTLKSSVEQHHVKGIRYTASSQGEQMLADTHHAYLNGLGGRQVSLPVGYTMGGSSDAHIRAKVQYRTEGEEYPLPPDLANNDNNQYEFELVDSDEVSDDDIDDMIKHINDWDDVVDAYDSSELSIIDGETGEHVADVPTTDEVMGEAVQLNEILSRVERIKSSLRFHRTAAKRERALQIALKRRSTQPVIGHRAKVIAIRTLKEKIARKPLSQFTIADKERIERIIQRSKGLINRIALKLIPRVRKIEQTRLEHPLFTK